MCDKYLFYCVENKKKEMKQEKCIQKEKKKKVYMLVDCNFFLFGDLF